MSGAGGAARSWETRDARGSGAGETSGDAMATRGTRGAGGGDGEGAASALGRLLKRDARIDAHSFCRLRRMTASSVMLLWQTEKHATKVQTFVNAERSHAPDSAPSLAVPTTSCRAPGGISGSCPESWSSWITGTSLRTSSATPQVVCSFVRKFNSSPTAAWTGGDSYQLASIQLQQTGIRSLRTTSRAAMSEVGRFTWCATESRTRGKWARDTFFDLAPTDAIAISAMACAPSFEAESSANATAIAFRNTVEETTASSTPSTTAVSRESPLRD
jgi:hypothetical protein